MSVRNGTTARVARVSRAGLERRSRHCSREPDRPDQARQVSAAIHTRPQRWVEATQCRLTQRWPGTGTAWRIWSCNAAVKAMPPAGAIAAKPAARLIAVPPRCGRRQEFRPPQRRSESRSDQHLHPPSRLPSRPRYRPSGNIGLNTQCALQRVGRAGEFRHHAVPAK